MDHWQLFTFSVLGFNFLAVIVMGVIIRRSLRKDGHETARPRKKPTHKFPKISADQAAAIADGSMHPLAAWRLGAGLSINDFGKAAKLTTDTVRQIETGATTIGPATEQFIVSAIFAGSAQSSAQSTSSAAPAQGTSAGFDGGASSSSFASSSDGGGGSC